MYGCADKLNIFTEVCFSASFNEPRERSALTQCVSARQGENTATNKLIMLMYPEEYTVNFEQKIVDKLGLFYRPFLS